MSNKKIIQIIESMSSGKVFKNTYLRPNLSSNGAFNGTAYSVRSNNEYRPAWYAASGLGAGYFWTTTGGTSPVVTYDFCTPFPMHLEGLIFVNRGDSGISAIKTFNMLGSPYDGGYSPVAEGSYTRTNSSDGATETVLFKNKSSNLLQYFRIQSTNNFAGYGDVNQVDIYPILRY